MTDIETITTDIKAITSGKNFSGEMFDLTATSFNDENGFAHIKAVMENGISLPITKFRDELQKIAATTSDDKSDKRTLRLSFLNSCIGCVELEELFTYYSNYLNGGGTNSSRENWTNDQYKSLMVITAAGGNIVILFAQLIVNMIDSFISNINTRDDGTGPEWKWDIKSKEPPYNPKSFLPELGALIYENYANEMFSKFISNSPPSVPVSDSVIEIYNTIIAKTFSLLTPTNKLLLTRLAGDSADVLSAGYGKNRAQELCYIIVRHFIQNKTSNPTILESLYEVAQSKISDFDFKLSPNIHPSLMGDSTYGTIDETFEKLGLNIIDPGHSGFLLVRIKTLIDCSTGQEATYTAAQLKEFQRDCYLKQLPTGIKVYGLFPQIMQQEYLTDVEVGSDCWIYLDYLMRKKHAIELATKHNIDETMKFHMAGNFKQAHQDGTMFADVVPALNSTEAIIDYISNTTYHLNIYIGFWETIITRTQYRGEEYKLSKRGAPALNHPHYGGLPANFSYETVCSNFKSLYTILYQNDDLVTTRIDEDMTTTAAPIVRTGVVTLLAADILNHFLNFPSFNTENILDKIMDSFINKWKKTAKMNPSNLTLVPTHRDFNNALSNIFHIITNEQYSSVGYPDGIRITLNAIDTNNKKDDSDSKIGKSEFESTTTGTIEVSELDKIESDAQQLSTNKTLGLNPLFAQLAQKTEEGAGIVKNPIFEKLRVKKLRVKKLRVKSRKQRTKKRKHKATKSRKYRKSKKSRKYRKSRKYKKEKNLINIETLESMPK